ncbi:MAG: hypothetical protein EB015_13955 [Methylocystaceae bacterium]|nr:hypothetical protein [Methylocystaceae bacterium]
MKFGKELNMDNQEEKLDLKLEDAPVAQDPVRESEPEAVQTDEDFRQANEVLKQQLEANRRALEEARYREQYAAKMAQEAMKEKAESQYHLVNNARDRVKADQDMLKSMMSQAYQEQDFDRVAEIQHAMNKNEFTLQELERGAEAMKNQPIQRVQPPRQASMDDLVENIAMQVEQNNSPRSAQWLRMNKQYLQDQRTINKMERAHYDALDDGIKPETDEYFSYVENRLGINRQRQVEDHADEDNPMSSASAPTQRRTPPPAAPVTRSGNGTGTRSNAVRLTPEQREIAKITGQTEQQYYDELQRAKKRGEITTH